MYLARPSAYGWLTVETGHIQLRTSIRRGVAVDLAREMQRAYDVLARYALPCAPKTDTDKIQVTVFPMREFPRYAPFGSIGFYLASAFTWLADYRGEIVLPEQDGARLSRIFQHELTHRLTAACFVRIPTWLNEGLAGFFETMVVESGTVTFGRPAYLITSHPRARHIRQVLLEGQPMWIVPLSALPSIERMVSLTGSLITHDLAESVSSYATAWALVHFLLVGAPDLTPRFEAYLAGLRTARGDPQALFVETFQDVPLQERFTAYLRGGRFDLLQSRPGVVDDRQDAPAIRVRDMPEHEGHLHLAWLLARKRDEHALPEFRGHLAAARENPLTRDAASLVAAMALYAERDLGGAEREVQHGLRDARDPAPFLEAYLDLLLAGRRPITELKRAAERLRPVARTAGQFCSLAQAARLMGDHEAALALSQRGLELDPRLVVCQFERR